MNNIPYFKLDFCAAGVCASPASIEMSIAKILIMMTIADGIRGDHFSSFGQIEDVDDKSDIRPGILLGNLTSFKA